VPAPKTNPKPETPAEAAAPTQAEIYDQLVALIRSDFQAAGVTGAEAKLWWIQCHVENVAKTGQAPKFDFYQEHGILTLTRPYQEALKVLLHVDEDDSTFFADGNLVQCTFVAEIVDLEQPFDSPERRKSGRYVMQSTDNQGWAAAKLQKFCGIPQDKLLEAEINAPKIERQAAPQPARGGVSAQKLSPLQRDVEAAAAADPAFIQRFTAHVVSSYKVQKIAQLTDPKHVDELRAWVAEQSA
jgi:hypothetical protein